MVAALVLLIAPILKTDMPVSSIIVGRGDWNLDYVAGKWVLWWMGPLKIIGTLTKSALLASTWTVGSRWSRFVRAVLLPSLYLLEKAWVSWLLMRLFRLMPEPDGGH